MQIFCVTSFLLLCGLIIYTVALYPLLLVWLAARFARPVFKREGRRTVSIIVAVYNGGPFIADKLNSIIELDYPSELIQILVVSDGSTDVTESIAARFAE